MLLIIACDHYSDIRLHLWWTQLFLSQEKCAIWPSCLLLDRAPWDLRRHQETVQCSSGGSWSTMWCTIHLVQPINALVVEVSPHHGHCITVASVRRWIEYKIEVWISCSQLGNVIYEHMLSTVLTTNTRGVVIGIENRTPNVDKQPKNVSVMFFKS